MAALASRAKPSSARTAEGAPNPSASAERISMRASCKCLLRNSVDGLQLSDQLFISQAIGRQHRMAVLDTLDVGSVDEPEVEFFGDRAKTFALVRRRHIGPVNLKRVREPPRPENPLHRLVSRCSDSRSQICTRRDVPVGRS